MVLISKIKSLVKSDYTTVFSFDMIGKILMAFAAVFLVRILSTEEYAIYTNFSEVGGIILSIIGTGLSLPYVAYSAEQNSRGKGNADILFNTCCLLMLCATIVALLFLPVFMHIYNLTVLLTLLGIIYGGVQSQNKLVQSYFQSNNEFWKSGITTNFKNLSLLICIIITFIILKNVSVQATSIITTLSACVALVASIAWVWKDSGYNGIKLSITLLKQLLRESKWLVLYVIFQSFFSSICIVILNMNGSTNDVATFGVAYKYYTLLLTFLTSLQTVLRVKTCQQEMVDSADKRREFSINWVKKVWPLSGAVSLMAVVSAGFIFPLLNGGGYESAVTVFRVLMIASFFGYVFSPNTAIMIAAKKHKLLFGLAVISCIIGGGLCYVLLPIVGVIAAAISIVTSNIFLNVTGYVIILLNRDKREMR